MSTIHRGNVVKRLVLGIGILSGLMGLGTNAYAQTESTELTRQMGIEQKLGAEIPRDVTLRDDDGKTIKFGELFGKRPVLFLPVFYRCQTGCALITDSLLKTLLKASHPSGFTGMVARRTGTHALTLGRDFDVVMLSINPKETPELAAAKKTTILKALDEPQSGKNWHLLTGDYDSIRKVTDAMGFRYFWDPKKDLIRHPTCSILVSPNGKISSYTIGNDFPTKILEDNLAVASRNEVGERADQSFMFGCLMLDPATGRIRVVVEGIVRVTALLTLLAVTLFIGRMVLQERRHGFDRGGQPSGT